MWPDSFLWGRTCKVGCLLGRAGCESERGGHLGTERAHTHLKWTAASQLQPTGHLGAHVATFDFSRMVRHPEFELTVFLNFRYWHLMETCKNALQAKTIPES